MRLTHTTDWISDQQQAYSAEFQRHIPKPIDPEKLLASIANLIEKIR
jgi:CheY-like chemotaxis protein